MKRRRGQHAPALNMRFIVMKHNRHEVPRAREFALTHGFELLTFRNLFFIESTTNAEISLRLSPGADANAGPRGEFICLEPFWFPTLFADGTVALCEQDYNAEMAVGRIEGGVSFTSVWKSEKAARLRRIIRDRRADVGFCRKCPYLQRPATDFNTETHVLTEEEVLR
jgi:radical SAM protein with 4Fe4S-binding SPASM domain